MPFEALARVMGVVDLAVAMALFRGWRPKWIAAIQAFIVAGYTFAFAIFNPALWLLPLGGLLKNFPILMLIGLVAVLEDER